MVLEGLDVCMQKKKKKVKHRPYTFHKTDSKWIINLNIKHNTIKLLEENVEKNLGDVRFGDECLHTTSKAQFMKENNGK